MTDFEHKAGKGSVWKNDDKGPAFRGSFKVHRAVNEGEILDIGLWNNETKSGKKYYGITIQDEWVKQDQPKESVESDQGNGQDLDDEIPF